MLRRNRPAQVHFITRFFQKQIVIETSQSCMADRQRSAIPHEIPCLFFLSLECLAAHPETLSFDQVAALPEEVAAVLFDVRPPLLCVTVMASHDPSSTLLGSFYFILSFTTYPLSHRPAHHHPCYHSFSLFHCSGSSPKANSTPASFNCSKTLK